MPKVGMQFSEARDQSIKEVEEVLMLLMQRATTSVRISTGLSTDLISHAGPKQAMEQCLARLPNPGAADRPMKVLLDPAAAGRAAPYDWWLRNPKVETKVSAVPIPHMFIIDDNTFRLEDPHSPQAAHRSNHMVIDAPVVAAEPVLRFFATLFAAASPY
jgi:hypothetical protein